jgi:hypothetical protein
MGGMVTLIAAFEGAGGGDLLAVCPASAINDTPMAAMVT